METSGWKEMVKSHPHLIAEAFKGITRLKCWAILLTSLFSSCKSTDTSNGSSQKEIEVESDKVQNLYNWTLAILSIIDFKSFPFQANVIKMSNKKNLIIIGKNKRQPSSIIDE